MASIVKAILAINPDALVSVNNNDINQITWNEGTSVIPNDQILTKQAELQSAFDAKQYQRDRTDIIGANTYPSIKDQLDMQYHDLVDDTTTWKDAITAVKEAHPKP